MERDHRMRSASNATTATHSAPTPGKRTLVEAIPVQRRAAGSAAGTGPAAPVGGPTHVAPTAPAAPTGQALPSALRRDMEHAFSADFADVRVHQGAQATDLGALAYAQGNELHFAPGAYDPASRAGRELIGHELTHVVQQRAGVVSAPQGKDGDSPAINADPALEAEADRLGAMAASGAPVRVTGAGHGAQPKMASGAVIQCGNKQPGNAEGPHKPGPEKHDDQKGKAAAISEMEKQNLIKSVFDRLKPIAIRVAQRQPKGAEYSYLSNWSENNIEKDALRIAITLGVSHVDANGLLGELVMKEACGDLTEARQAILEEYERRFGAPRSAPDDSKPDTNDKEPESPDELKNYKYRYYTRTYHGTDALIAMIVNSAVFGKTAADYGIEVIEHTIKKMSSHTPPNQAPAQILREQGVYYQAIIAAAREVHDETHGAKGMGTQIGNTRAEYKDVGNIDSSVILANKKAP